jgi:cytochrome c oxidase assembly protein subunit 11
VQPGSENSDSTSRSNRRVVFVCVAALSLMTGITAYSPTLYRMFCSLTGYGGTAQRVESNSDKVLDRTITVRFDSNIAPHLAWKFEPEVTKMDVKIGETSMAYFKATNLENEPVTGQAGFNVTPEVMGIYFNKIACFCFNEQTLKPHETVEMPVTFFIDPKMVEDSSTKNLSEVVLSYTFYPVEKATANSTSKSEKSGG